MQSIPQLPPIPDLPGASLAQTNPSKALDLINAQINGIKQEIGQLRQELVPGTSDARENAINEQISSANDRLDSLQEQFDRLVSGRPFEMQPPQWPDGNPRDVPPGVRNLLESGMVTLVFIVLGYPLVRLIARRLEPRPKADPATDMNPRLDRLEQGMDAVAIEVERISEGQRFTNKLLSEQRALPAPNPMDQWAASRPKVEEKIERR